MSLMRASSVETRCLPVEQATLAEGRLQGRVEMGERARQGGDGLGLAGDAGIENLCLRHVDFGAEIGLVGRNRAVQPDGSVLAGRHQIGEAEPAARQRPRAAGEIEFAACDAVENCVAGFEIRRAPVDSRGKSAVSRRAVDDRRRRGPRP